MQRRWPGRLAAFVLGLIFLPVLLLLLAVMGRAAERQPLGAAGLGERARRGGARSLARAPRRGAAQSGRARATRPRSSPAWTLYRENCAGCHGGARGPSAWGSGNFYPRVPQFWQEHHEHVTPAEAFVAVRDGIRYSGMGAWRGMLTEPEMWQVANFVSRMHALPARVDARWRAGPAGGGMRGEERCG